MSTNTFLQKYKILNKIGEGSFSEVLKCRDIRTGEYLAAKRLKKRFETIDEVFGCAEIIAMQKISRHRNILYMKEFHFDPFLGKVTYLFELMDMSLYDFMKLRKRSIPEARGKNYLFQILSGLAHIHKNGLFHRDIKPENILIKIPLEQSPPLKYEVVKIADLGSIRGIYSRPPYTEYISTRWYRSPECLLTAGYYGLKMDVWATGCVFYEMLTLKPLFPGSNELDQLSRIHAVLGTPPPKLVSRLAAHKSCNCKAFARHAGSGLAPLLAGLTPDAQDVMRHMLVYDPELRASVKRLLEHRYFCSYRDRSDKVLQRRVSFTEGAPAATRTPSHAAPQPPPPPGDWRARQQLQAARRANDKYITSANRASQNNVLDMRASATLKRAKEPAPAPPPPVPRLQLKSTSLQGCARLQPGAKECAFRKTLSNIPQLVAQRAAASPASLPRLQPPPAAAAARLPKPPKVLILDSALRHISASRTLHKQ